MEMEVKQDINFLDKPLWFQDLRHEKGVFIWTDIEGYEYRTGYKLPDKVDIIILLYLLLRSQKLNYQQVISLTRYEILKECGLIIKGDNYQRLVDSLKRWKNVSIDFHGTFYDGKKYITIGFGIINDYAIDINTKLVTIDLNQKWLLKIRESTFFKYINFEYYKSLKRPVSRRLFEILCKTFKNRNTWSISLIKLGTKLTICGRKISTETGEKEVIYASDVLVVIKPAINEINKLFDIPNISEKLNISINDLFKVEYKITGNNQDRIIHFTKCLIKDSHIVTIQNKTTSNFKIASNELDNCHYQSIENRTELDTIINCELLENLKTFFCLTEKEAISRLKIFDETRIKEAICVVEDDIKKGIAGLKNKIRDIRTYTIKAIDEGWQPTKHKSIFEIEAEEKERQKNIKEEKNRFESERIEKLKIQFESELTKKALDLFNQLTEEMQQLLINACEASLEPFLLKHYTERNRKFQGASLESTFNQFIKEKLLTAEQRNFDLWLKNQS